MSNLILSLILIFCIVLLYSPGNRTRVFGYTSDRLYFFILAFGLAAGAALIYHNLNVLSV